MIKISAPATFSDSLIKIYQKLNKKYASRHIKIAEVYGALPAFTTRESSRLPKITLPTLIEYAKNLQKIGVNFNYALNSTTITYEQIEKTLSELIKKLSQNGIKTFTVSSPLLIEYLHRQFPDIEIVVSTVSHIDSIRRIKQVESFGAKRIILELRTNRNFKLLSSLDKLSRVEFEILVNEFCGDCSIRNIHYTLQSIDSTYTSGNKFFDEYPYSICSRLFWHNLPNVLKNYWVLPDWLKMYQEKFNISWFKITDRTIKDLKWHEFILSAYMSQNYQGNLMNLRPGRHKPVFFVKAEKIKKSGYLEHFLEKQEDCKNICGISCQFCDKLAKKLTNK